MNTSTYGLTGILRSNEVTTATINVSACNLSANDYPAIEIIPPKGAAGKQLCRHRKRDTGDLLDLREKYLKAENPFMSPDSRSLTSTKDSRTM